MKNSNSTSKFQKAKPFLKWAGGKTQLLATIDGFLPPEFSSSDPITYIEPFVGGGALLFYLLQKYPNINKAVINDINPHLIKTYRMIRDDVVSLIICLREMEKEFKSLNGYDRQKDYYLKVRETFNNVSLPDIEEAASLIFLNRTCFNGLYRENSKGCFNVSFGRYSNPTIADPNLLSAVATTLQKVEILHGDFSQISSYADHQSFIYFDPPYRPINSGNNFTSYSKENFNDREQVRLKNFFEEMNAKGCRLLLSNSDGMAADNDNTYMDDLYSNFTITRVYAKRSISRDPSKRGPIPELLIRNYIHCKGMIDGFVI